MNPDQDQQPLFEPFGPEPMEAGANLRAKGGAGGDRLAQRKAADGVQHLHPQKSSAFSPVSVQQWNDWQWHVRNRITTVQELERWISLSVEEKRAIHFSQGRSHFSLSPYWVSLMDPDDLTCPIRRQAIPLDEEFRSSFHESHESNEAVRVAGGRLVHLYPDRAALSVQSQCIVYCRFCPQRRVPEGQDAGAQALRAEASFPSEEAWKEILHYLSYHPQIQEIILSGGEPLLLRDELLRRLLERLREVPSVKAFRVETRMLSVLPQRITPELVQLAREFQPLYFVAHVNHAREITPEFTEAAGRLADAGIPLLSQTTLLREINDKAQSLSDLFSALYRLRIRPYRLIQCVPAQGIEHFRTSISSGLRLIEFLRGRMTGLALPEYVVDTAGGKVPLRYESILSRNRKRIMLKNYEGKVFVYPEKNFIV